MKNLKSIFLLCLAAWLNAESLSAKTVLRIVDPAATPETKALYANLWLIQQKGVMFGHHDYATTGIGWVDEPGRSDVKDIVGDYPAVYSLDIREIYGVKMENLKAAYRRGGVIMLCWHQNNPLTETSNQMHGKGIPGGPWDNTKVVDQILVEGSAMNVKYKKRLDGVAEIFKTMVDDEGKPIPVIFRPLHEHTQKWNWWGSESTTEQEFIAFWRFIVSYLRDEKGVHNLIYAISPQMDAVYKDTKARLMYRWPGNEWVDILGMDCYHGKNRPAFESNVKAISELSVTLNKPVAVTETGRPSDHPSNYWTYNVLPPLKGHLCSMVVLWRNSRLNHAFGPYPSDASASDFKVFYDDPYTIFERDLPDMYKMPKGIGVE